MKKLLTALALTAFTGSVFAQNIAEQSVAPQGSSFANHLKHFSWLYITAFVVLVGFFVAGYLFGWDKKLFRSKAAGEDNHMFI